MSEIENKIETLKIPETAIVTEFDHRERGGGGGEARREVALDRDRRFFNRSKAIRVYGL